MNPLQTLRMVAAAIATVASSTTASLAQGASAENGQAPTARI